MATRWCVKIGDAPGLDGIEFRYHNGHFGHWKFADSGIIPTFVALELAGFSSRIFLKKSSLS